MAIDLEPQSREEMYLASIDQGGKGTIPATPQSRKEMYLESINEEIKNAGGATFYEFNTLDDVKDEWKKSPTNGDPCVWKMPTGFYKANETIGFYPYDNTHKLLQKGDVLLVLNAVPLGAYVNYSSYQISMSNVIYVYRGRTNGAGIGSASGKYDSSRKVIDSGQSLTYLTEIVTNSSDAEKTAFKTALGL